MKRKAITLAAIARYDNLSLALYKAAKGKRYRKDVLAFMQQPEMNLNRLGVDIRAGKLPYGRFRCFAIRDPKPRIIHAACFEDRVFHHALMNHAAPILENAMLPTSFACRPGKGVHQAVKRVQHNLRRFSYYGKVDINAYFATVRHDRLLEVLLTRFKGKELTGQLQRILDSHEFTSRCGLPIGSLTSQYFANYYLDGLDRLLAGLPQVRAQIRYMDDVLWWSDSRCAAREVLNIIAIWLREKRALLLKPNAQIQASQQGVTYCGFRITQGAIRLSRRRKKRFLDRRQYWESHYQAGNISSTELQQLYASVQAITEHTDSLAWRRENLRRHPSLDV